MFDPYKLKQDFPLLTRKINGHPLVYLDNASTTQKPNQVIKAITNFYEKHNSNIHRGIHTLSEEATALYENTRALTKEFINAAYPEEIIFTRNTTESINLIAKTWGEENIKKGDEIILSILEHHSNFVPWQQLAHRKNATIKIIPIKNDLSLDLEKFETLLTKKTAFIGITAMSNAIGTITPLKEIIKKAHTTNAKILIDAAQSISSTKFDVQALNPDFIAFSSHKMFGPTGVGVLYAKKEILEDMPPFLHGGDMIKSVRLKETIYNDLPHRFEAGTPNIADTVAFEEAIKYLKTLDSSEIYSHYQSLLKYAKEIFSKYPEVTLYSPENSGPILSFTIKDIHPHDIATIFDSEGVAIRSGHHCAQPLMDHLKLPATARISFSLYNTKEDIAQTEKAIQKTIKTFA